MEADTVAVRGDIARIDESMVRVHERIDDLAESINRQMQHAEKAMDDLIARHEKAEGAMVDAKIAVAIHPIKSSIERIEAKQAHRAAVVDTIAADISGFKEIGTQAAKWALRLVLVVIGFACVGLGTVVSWYVHNYDWITRLVGGLQKLAGE